MWVNIVSTNFGLVSEVIDKCFGSCYAKPTYWLPLEAKTKVTCSLPHPENEDQLSTIDFGSCILGNIGVGLWPWFIYEVLVACSGKSGCDIYDTPLWKWASSECQQFLVLHIGNSMHCVDTWAHIRTIDGHYRQIYNKSNGIHWFQNNWYRTLQIIYKVITGCWISIFDNLLFPNSNYQSIIWIHKWTCWATCWPSGQFTPVWTIPTNCTRIDGPDILTTQTANSAMVQLHLSVGSEATVWNSCDYLLQAAANRRYSIKYKFGGIKCTLHTNIDIW